MPTLAEATDGTWSIELVEDTTNQKWKFELRNLGRFDEVFGRGVLTEFCRCFVHVNRLTSVTSCMHTSEQYHGRDSLAHTRNLNTLMWFAVGTLRELALAIHDLREALHSCGRLEPATAPWVKLDDLEQRWTTDQYRRMRNKVAFHLDSCVVETGLNQLVEGGNDVTVAEGDSPRQVDSRLTLGFLALHNGLDLDPDGLREFIELAMDDHGAAGQAIQEAFVLAAEAVR